MRRIVGTGLIGLGVFLVVAAGMLRFYAYPALARVPTNYDSMTRLEAKGAQVFNTNPKVLAPQTTDLSVAAHTVADSRIDAPDGVAVWVTSTTITRADGSIFQQSRERVPFDDVSGAGVRCDQCGSWDESTKGEQVDTTFEGQVLKFPFHTGKHDYQVWDDTIGTTATAKYAGETEVKGLKVYKFVQTIAPRVVSHQQVPGSVFGVKAASVKAAMVYGMTRTLYVEPATGSPVNRIEDRDQELRYAGTSVPAFVGTVQYTDAQVAQSVSDVKTKAMLLDGARTWIPLLGLALGMAMVLLGLVLTRPTTATNGVGRTETRGRPLVGV